MKKMLAFLVAGVFSIVMASAAAAAEVTTEYFTINLPDGWTQPMPVQNSNGATMALFQNKKDGSAVTITVAANGLSAKDVAAQTVANMKQGGMNPSEPKEENGLYVSSFQQGKGKGVSYFGSNGKVFAVTTIVGADVQSGKDLLKALKPVDPKLFPAF